MGLLNKAAYTYVGVAVPLTIIIPIVPALVKYTTLSRELKTITWYLFVSTLSNIITRVLANYYINNMPVMHFYTIVEFLLLFSFYKHLLRDSKIGKYLNIILFVFTAIWAFNLLFFQKIFTFNSYSKSIEALFIIFFGITYFIKTLDSISLNTSKAGTMHINSGLLVYFSGSFIMFTLFNKMVNKLDFFLIAMSIHATFLVILYILIAVALWKYKAPVTT